MTQHVVTVVTRLPARAGLDSGEDLELTIVMPCLDEADTIETCVQKALRFLERTGTRGEVLIADNGSCDGSPDLARRLGARVIAVPRRGYGSALIQGIAAAHGRYVIMGDADDSYDFSALDDMLAELRDGADLVMGNRFAGGIEPGAMPPLHRYLGNPVLSFVGRLFFSCPIGDFHCGLRGFRRDVARSLDLRTTGMEFASELVVKAALAKSRIVEVPVVLHPDGRSRPPHLRSWRDGWRHLRFLLLFSPRWLLFYPGLAVMLAAAGVLGLLGFGAWSPGRGRLAEGMLVGAGGLLIIGVQAVQFSVLARVFAQTQRLLPPIRRRLGRMIDRVTLELGLVSGVALVLIAVAGVIASLVVSRSSDPHATVAPLAFRLGVCSVVLGVLGLQVILGTTFLSILRLDRLGTTR
ncbi:MAG TPA: glycosyltransferase family 2 protein [Mycobacteriales bacterium]|nr:glycosyltransferase family 2 protein [Mycobacteriales bacterium]